MAGAPPGPDGAEAPEPPGLRRLRRLVTALTVTLILGVITITLLLVIRLTALAPPPPLPSLPRSVALPPGEAARAVTFGGGWLAVVTADPSGLERIRVFDATSGAARGELALPSANQGSDNSK